MNNDIIISLLGQIGHREDVINYLKNLPKIIEEEDHSRIRSLVQRVRGMGKFPDGVDVVNSYLSSRTEFANISTQKLYCDFYNHLHPARENGDVADEIDQLYHAIRSLIRGRGYRAPIDYLTPGEFSVLDTSLNDESISRLLNQTTVLAIASGSLTLEEAKFARALNPLLWTVHGRIEPKEYGLLLPPIDARGMSTKSPYVIDAGGKVLSTSVSEFVQLNH